MVIKESPSDRKSSNSTANSVLESPLVPTSADSDRLVRSVQLSNDWAMQQSDYADQTTSNSAPQLHVRFSSENSAQNLQQLFDANSPKTSFAASERHDSLADRYDRHGLAGMLIKTR
jgi:hypothetical protein